MDGTSRPTRDTTPRERRVLVAHVVDQDDIRGGEHPVREYIRVDQTELADLVREALVETRRVRGPHTADWGDAAEAASLIIQHVSEVTAPDAD